MMRNTMRILLLMWILIPTTVHAQEVCNGPECDTPTPTEVTPTKTRRPTNTPTETLTEFPTNTPTDLPSATLSPTIITPVITETKKPTETLWAYPTRTKKPQLPSSGFGPPDEIMLIELTTGELLYYLALAWLAGMIMGTFITMWLIRETR